MVGWHHWLNGHGFGWTRAVGDGAQGLTRCGSWGLKELDTTERLNWTELEHHQIPSEFYPSFYSQDQSLGPLVKFPGVEAKPCEVTKASCSRERETEMQKEQGESCQSNHYTLLVHMALWDFLKHSHGWYHVLLVRWARKGLLAPLHREGSWAQDLHAGSIMGGWTASQFCASLVGKWGGYLTCTSRTLQDRKPDHVLRQPRAQAGRIGHSFPTQPPLTFCPQEAKGMLWTV